MRSYLLAVAAAFNVPAPMVSAPAGVTGLVTIEQPALRGAVVVPQGAQSQSLSDTLTYLVLGFSFGVVGTVGLKHAALSVSGQERLSRREALAKALGATAFLGAAAANADIDYAGVGYLGGSTTIDVNNSNIRVYQKLPGMYPNAAGKLVTNAPYKNKDEMYSKAKFSPAEQEAVKKYDSRFIFLEPRPEYIIDNINNGLYR
jgi:photosystem II PsbU protein